MRFDRDRFNNLHEDEVGRGIMHIADRTQLRDPSVQVMASAGYFLFLCDHMGITPHDAVTAFRNLLDRSPGHKVGIRAARAYIENEII